MLQLYPYQEQTIQELREGFRKHKRQLMVIPTGGGKTVCFSTMVASAVSKGGTVLALTDRIELFNQTVEAVDEVGVPVCKISAEHKHITELAKCYIGMVETVKRRKKHLESIKIDLIICDEAHVANFNKIFEIWPESFVIGATATPIGKHLYKYYTNLVSCIDTPELVEKGFLTPCRAFQMMDDFSDLKTDKSGEFTDISLTDHFVKPKLFEGVIEKWLEKFKGTKTIVFNCNIQHTLEMTRAFQAAGIKSYAITSKTPDDERAWILKEFAEGKFDVLNNCGILTKGFNDKSVTTIVLNRATTSLALFLQMIGRGSRTLPDKFWFNVLDFGGNHDRFGLWNTERKWTLMPPKKKKKNAIAPIRTCPQCGAMLPASQRQCGYCGHVMDLAAMKLLQGELIEITPKIPPRLLGKKISEATIDELIHMEKEGEINSTYAWRILRSRGEEAIVSFATKKGFKRGWIERQLETMYGEMQAGGTTFNDYTLKEKTQPTI